MAAMAQGDNSTKVAGCFGAAGGPCQQQQQQKFKADYKTKIFTRTSWYPSHITRFSTLWHNILASPRIGVASSTHSLTFGVGSQWNAVGTLCSDQACSCRGYGVPNSADLTSQDSRISMVSPKRGAGARVRVGMLRGGGDSFEKKNELDLFKFLRLKIKYRSTV